jgi:hypothetical protein
MLYPSPFLGSAFILLEKVAFMRKRIGGGTVGCGKKK